MLKTTFVFELILGFISIPFPPLLQPSSLPQQEHILQYVGCAILNVAGQCEGAKGVDIVARDGVVAEGEGTFHRVHPHSAEVARQSTVLAPNTCKTEVRSS